VQVFSEIAAVAQLSRNRLERSLPAGLSQAQFSLLVRLAGHGAEENPADLARAFQLTKGAMTNTLQRLEAPGFVRIEDDAGDRRRKRVRITPAGLAACQGALAAARPAMDALRTRFSDAEFAAVLPFLTALREWLDENR
jgi:DNA-binding MarR family transcriptional regulator